MSSRKTRKDAQHAERDADHYRSRLLGALLNARAGTAGRPFDCRRIARSDFRPTGPWADKFSDGEAAAFLADALGALEHGSGVRLVPVHTLSDGSCLPHAVSRSLMGKEIFYDALRLSLQGELEAHAGWYAEHLNTGALWMGEEEWAARWKSLCEAAAPTHGERTHRYLENEHILGLANVLGRPVLLLDNLTAAGLPEHGWTTPGLFLPLRFSRAQLSEAHGGKLPGPVVIGWQGSSHNHYVSLVRLNNDDEARRNATGYLELARDRDPGFWNPLLAEAHRKDEAAKEAEYEEIEYEEIDLPAPPALNKRTWYPFRAGDVYTCFAAGSYHTVTLPMGWRPGMELSLRVRVGGRDDDDEDDDDKPPPMGKYMVIFYAMLRLAYGPFPPAASAPSLTARAACVERLRLVLDAAAKAIACGAAPPPIRKSRLPASCPGFLDVLVGLGYKEELRRPSPAPGGGAGGAGGGGGGGGGAEVGRGWGPGDEDAADALAQADAGDGAEAAAPAGAAVAAAAMPPPSESSAEHWLVFHLEGGGPLGGAGRQRALLDACNRWLLRGFPNSAPPEGCGLGGGRLTAASLASVCGVAWPGNEARGPRFWPRRGDRAARAQAKLAGKRHDADTAKRARDAAAAALAAFNAAPAPEAAAGEEAPEVAPLAAPTATITATTATKDARCDYCIKHDMHPSSEMFAGKGPSQCSSCGAAKDDAVAEATEVDHVAETAEARAQRRAGLTADLAKLDAAWRALDAAIAPLEADAAAEAAAAAAEAKAEEKDWTLCGAGDDAREGTAAGAPEGGDLAASEPRAAGTSSSGGCGGGAPAGAVDEAAWRAAVAEYGSGPGDAPGTAFVVGEGLSLAEDQVEEALQRDFVTLTK